MDPMAYRTPGDGRFRRGLSSKVWKRIRWLRTKMRETNYDELLDRILFQQEFHPSPQSASWYRDQHDKLRGQTVLPRKREEGRG